MTPGFESAMVVVGVLRGKVTRVMGVTVMVTSKESDGESESHGEIEGGGAG